MISFIATTLPTNKAGGNGAIKTTVVGRYPTNLNAYRVRRFPIIKISCASSFPLRILRL